MAFINPIIDIVLITLVVVVISRILQAKLVNKKEQKAAQKRMKEKQAKIKELMKNSDEKSKSEMDRLQKEMFEDMNATMQGSMRYMMFSLPLFLGAFFVLGQFYGGQVLTSPTLLPKFDNFFFLNPFTWMPTGWGYETGWLKLYFVTYLISSIVIALAMKVWEKTKGKSAKVEKQEKGTQKNEKAAGQNPMPKAGGEETQKEAE